MSEHRHGLESLVGGSNESASFTLEIRATVGHINLRFDSDESLAAIQSVLGQDVPREANTVTEGEYRICWLGPDEYLVQCSLESTPALVASLESAVSGMHVAVNDISGGTIDFRLGGDDVPGLLSRGTTLDLDKLVSGQCAQSGLAKAAALFIPLADQSGFDLVVRRSFAEYLLLWLRDTAGQAGLAVVEESQVS